MAFQWRRANPLGSLTLLRSHPELSGLAVAKFLADLSHVVLPSVFVLYAGYRYGWDEQTIGLTLAAVGVVRADRAGRPGRAGGEMRSASAARCCSGLLGGVAGFVVFGLAATGVQFFIGIPLLSLWGIASPATNGLMTRRVGPSEQGQLQGANSSIQGIANLAGPFMFTLTFAYFIGAGAALHLPGAPFLLAAALLAAAAVMGWRVTRER